MRIQTGSVTIISPRIDGFFDAQIDVQSKVFTHVSSRLLQDQAESRRSVNKWFSDKLASHTPRAVFTVTARTAQRLTAGQEIPIQLTLNYDKQKSNLQPPPEMQLLEVKYKIRGHTHVVSRGTLSPEQYMDYQGTVFKRHLKFDSLFLIDGENLDVGMSSNDDGGLRRISLDAVLVSPFTTYNICRWYEAEISILFECGGKEMRAKFIYEPAGHSIQRELGTINTVCTS